MEVICRKKKHLGIGWPGEDKIRALAGRAFGLFVWASIVCKFIDAHDPQKRLDVILQGSATSGAEAALDVLYRTALESSGLWDDEDFVADFRTIIGMMLVLRNPLSGTAIDSLLAAPDGRPSIETIKQLSCLVSSDPTIRFIHPSLADFFMTRSRCGRDIWFFEQASHERTLSSHCLRHLDQVLRHDMSELGLSTNNNDIFPEDVTYACIFWVDHICAIQDDLPPIESLLRTFIDQHVLHWFEAMSVLKKFSLVIALLDQLSEWVQMHFPPVQRSLLELVRYWWRFSQTYETLIEECPMQVYSTELHQEFRIIEVQEPLVARSNSPSAWNVQPRSPSIRSISSSRNSSSSSLSRPPSPCRTGLTASRTRQDVPLLPRSMLNVSSRRSSWSSFRSGLSPHAPDLRGLPVSSDHSDSVRQPSQSFENLALHRSYSNPLFPRSH